MKRYPVFILYIFLLIGLSSLFHSCEKEESVQEESDKRTVLAYLIAENNLATYASKNVTAMMEGMTGTSGVNMNLLVYLDDGYSTPTLWKIEKNSRGEVIKTAVKTYNAQNSADTEVMKNVICDGFGAYPAREKGLILWSHGSGWLPSPNYPEDTSGRNRAFGQDGTEWMELWDIRTVLENSGLHFDFMIFDACHMANVEVAYELKDYTDYLIASSTEIMGDGFPYAALVPIMNKESLDLKEICRGYMHVYNGSTAYLGGTISLIDTRRLPELASYFGQIIRTTTRTGEDLRKSYIQEFGRRISYNTTYRNIFYDLDNYVNLLEVESAAGFADLLNEVVPFKAHTEQFGFTGGGGEVIDIFTSCGLTVFIPEINSNEKYNTAYQRLLWYEATR